MLTLIIGQNAIGKSVYIKEEAKRAMQEDENVLCNFISSDYLKNIRYNQERIEILGDLLDANEIKQSAEMLFIDRDMPITKKFTEIVTLICKNGDRLFLDEPEYKLHDREIGMLVAFIYRVADTFKQIEIVTHSELFLGILSAEIKTVKKDKYRYVLTDLEDAYDTID